MDLSRLSNEDLMAIKSGNMGGVSDAGLKILSGQPTVSRGEDMVRAIGSGFVRAVPKTLDFAMGAGGEAVNQIAGAMGGKQAPFGAIYDDSTYFNDAMSAALGDEYEPEFASGDVAKFLAELTGGIGGGTVKLLRNAAGAVKGASGSLDNYIRDPEKLREMYVAWKDGLKNVAVSSKELRRDLVNPTVEKIGEDLRFATKEGKSRVDEMLEMGTDDATLADVYALRRSTSNLKDDAVAQPIRDSAKQFIGDRVGTEGLDQYRRYATAGDVQNALRNMGNEGIKATRTKINNLDEAGMTAAEVAAKRAAGRGSMGENAVRNVERAFGAMPSAFMFGPLAPVTYLGGKAVGSAADNMAANRIKALQEVLLNGRQAPNLGERAGALLRDILMKAR